MNPAPVVHWLRETVGRQISRIKDMLDADRDLFFALLKEREFAPAHIIDVGANHGDWTRASLRFFPEAFYTLIEPQDNLKSHSRDLLDRNPRIRWISAGAADQCGVLPFTIRERHDESTFARQGSNQIKVPVTTLNEVAKSKAVPFPDMVKIDAEGFDLKVLKGASDLLGKTDVFFVETIICGNVDLENSLATVIHVMDQAGYRAVDFTEIVRTRDGANLLTEVAFLYTRSALFNGLVFERNL